MNKRFFTLMAAALLAGAPFASEAFAAPKASIFVCPTDHAFANGAKIILAPATAWDPRGFVTAVGSPVMVDEVTFGGKKYVTFAASGSTTAQEATFEVANFSASKLGATFNLKVNGLTFVVSSTGGVASSSDYKSDFSLPYNKYGYVLDENLTINIVGGTSLAQNPATYSMDYTAAELNEFNASSTSFSFGGEAVEGNVFSGLIPVTCTAAVGDEFPVGTYFVKGSKDDIDAFKSAKTKAAAKKLTFVAITTAKWGLNTSVVGEGLKIAEVSGELFSASTPLSMDNAAFSITEFDQLNCEGELAISATIDADADGSPETVYIVAVKASASDTKTYVTTVTEDTNFKTGILPALGNNTYFAASEFLKSGETASAYNVYFTSGSAVAAGKQPHEFGRYLSVVSDGLSYALNATNPDSTNVNAPASQWIVSDFDGKYKVTLTNRENAQSLVLRLEATSVAGQYKIAGEDATTPSKIANIVAMDGTTPINTVAGRTIKLIPTTLTKNDGYLALSKDELANGLLLGFSGKTALQGAVTYYAAYDKGSATVAPALVPALDAKTAVKLAKVDDSSANLISTKFAYIDKNGQIAKDGVDSLYVPTYTISYDDKYAVTNLNLTATTASAASKYFFKKHISGKYAMGEFSTTSLPNTAGANAINVRAWTATTPAFLSTFAVLNNLKNEDFAYVTVSTEDVTDYNSLEAVSRHATLENNLGAVSLQENKNGILEGILSAEALTFWLDTADSDTGTPAFYISVGTGEDEEEVETKAYNDEVRFFLYNPADSATVYNPGSATSSTDKKYILEGSSNIKAIFRPAALIAEDTLTTVKGSKEVTVVTKDADAAKGQVNGLNAFQYRITLADPDIEDEYVVKSKKDSKYLYSLNGRLGFTANSKEAMVFTLGAGDPTANEAIEAESGIEVIGGQGVVTVQGAAGKVITVANILGQTIANQVAASDNVTIAAPAGIVVVSVDGDATKVIVK